MHSSSLRFALRLGAALCALCATLAATAQTAVVRQLRNTGPNANRVNVAILGDGYTAAQQEKFFTDAQRKLDVLLNNEAFVAFKDSINGVAIFTASNEDGTDVPLEKITRDTYYDTTYGDDVATVARLLFIASSGFTRAGTVLRANAPDYDIPVMLVNTTRYGGSGGSITVASLDSSSDEVLLHEIGHSFAKLTDEYVDALVAANSQPGEYPNATQKTARNEIVWRDFIQDSTLLPTPGTSADVNYIGLFEGSNYRPTGSYRPVYDSKMRSLNRPFGAVNLRAFATAFHKLDLNNATAAPGNLAVTAPLARANAGSPLSLAIAAEGTGPFTYQWSFNGKFLPGETASTLRLPIAGPAVAGAYAVEVTNAAGATTSTNSGITARVAQNGAAYEVQIGTQPVVRWLNAAPVVSEDAGFIVLTVSRTGSAGALSAAYTMASGTATAGADFTAQNGTLTWADGDGANKTIRIPIAADTANEGAETFTVTLGNPVSNGVTGVVAGSAAATVTIVEPGTRDPAFAAGFINNSVNSIVPLADGSLLIAGFFTALQDSDFTNVTVGRIARLKPTGYIDRSFNSGTGADAVIYAMVRQPDGKILIGGDFANYNGTARSRIARLNADGSLDTSFNPGTGADRVVYDLLLQTDGKILVGGMFTTMNGTPREYLVRLNADGSIDTSFTGPDFGGTTGWWVHSLLAQPDGRVLVAGVFFQTGSSQRASICRINANGALDPTFDGIVQGAGTALTGTSLGEIRQVALQADGRILIAGAFSSYNGTSRRGIARLLSNGALDPSFDPGAGIDQQIETLVVQADGRVIIGGRFTTVNGAAANHLARLLPTGTLDPTFMPAGGPSATVTTLLAQADGTVLFGGVVGSFPTAPANRPLFRFLAGTPSGATGPGTPNNPETPTVSQVGRLVNLSIRTDLASADDNFTFGFVVGGANTSGTKALLVRAVGPSLVPFGVTDALVDPRLEFYTGTVKVGENDNWGGSSAITAAMAQVGAFALAGSDSRDAVLSFDKLAAGPNSAKIFGTGAGAVLAELYDATPTASFTSATPRLVNVSVLKNIGKGVTAGFVIGGSTSRKVLIRVIGPTLGGFGVSDAVADPQFALYRGETKLDANDNWGGSATLSAAFTQVGAFGLDANSKDAALLADLRPDNYTVQVSGVGGTSGTALVEIYEVP